MTATITGDRLYDLRAAVRAECGRTIHAALAVAGYEYTDADLCPMSVEYAEETLALHARDLAHTVDALPIAARPDGWDTPTGDTHRPDTLSLAVRAVVRAALDAAAHDFTASRIDTPRGEAARQHLALAARLLAQVVDGLPPGCQPLGWGDTGDAAWWRHGRTLGRA
ncbi:hypothetical protein GCM10010124_26620 [Pilimelia terevasa]|uniref:Uncharacterized protein n=1 Tax=Pilimelia terevasa TaxID=53372 RepID=A0A8J3BMR5_9ACTN|nr:hypothetical protein [Pilimelia terevasa]GGK32505.1 hypothetical protein GCM10010124_26620 [Pilimelia terevasa]